MSQREPVKRYTWVHYGHGERATHFASDAEAQEAGYVKMYASDDYEALERDCERLRAPNESHSRDADRAQIQNAQLRARLERAEDALGEEQA